MRETGVFADRRRDDHQAAVGGDGAAGDGGAGIHLDGDGLAGDHALVDRCAARDDTSVGGDLLPGTHDEHVADLQLLDRHACAGLEFDITRGQLHEGAHGGTGATLGALLDDPSQQKKDGDGGRHLEVDERRRVVDGHEEAGVVRHPDAAGAAEQQRPQAPEVRGAGAERDEGVHRHRAVSRVGERRTVERPAAPQHHRGGKDERNPLPARELPGRDHAEHHDRQRQHRADDQPRAQRHRAGAVLDVVHVAAGCRRARGMVGVGVLRVRVRVAAVVDGGGGTSAHVGVVPRFAHGGDERVGIERGRVVHACRFRGEVDRCRHAVQPLQPLLDAGDAARAGHPLDVEDGLGTRVVGRGAHCPATRT